MENASKALIIAGGVLLSVLVISLFVFGWNKMSDYQRRKEATKHNQQEAEFNEQYESYAKKVITGYDLLTLANLASNYNEEFQADEDLKKSGYRPLEIGVELSSPGGRLPGLKYGDAVIHKGESDQGNVRRLKSKKEYFDATDYADWIMNNESQIPTSDLKQFKELYFECTKVEYDKNNGRIYRMLYDEEIPIEKK